MSTSRKFWMVRGGGPCSVEHAAESEAVEEAKRLAAQRPGCLYTILESKESYLLPVATVQRVDADAPKARPEDKCVNEHNASKRVEPRKFKAGDVVRQTYMPDDWPHSTVKSYGVPGCGERVNLEPPNWDWESNLELVPAEDPKPKEQPAPYAPQVGDVVLSTFGSVVKIARIDGEILTGPAIPFAGTVDAKCDNWVTNTSEIDRLLYRPTLAPEKADSEGEGRRSRADDNFLKGNGQ